MQSRVSISSLSSFSIALSLSVARIHRFEDPVSSEDPRHNPVLANNETQQRGLDLMLEMRISFPGRPGFEAGLVSSPSAVE